jgi:hypothetical protein
MSSRPTKRQRIDSSSAVCSQNDNVSDREASAPRQCGGSPHLISLVDRLLETTHKDHQSIPLILSKLRICLNDSQSCSLDESSFHTIHGALVLSLGYWWSSWKNSFRVKMNEQAVLCSLVTCLRDLYNRYTPLRLDMRDIDETLTVVPTVIIGMFSVARKKKTLLPGKCMNTLTALFCACFQVLQLLISIPVVFHQQQKPLQSSIKRVLLGLLMSSRYFPKQDNPGFVNVHALLANLKMVTVREPFFHRQLELASMAIETLQGKSAALPSGDVSNKDRMILWQYVAALSDINVCPICPSRAESALDDLTKYSIECEDESHSILSMEISDCFGAFFQSASETFCQDVLTRIIVVLLGASNREHHQTLSCLQSIEACMQRTDGPYIFLQTRESGQSIDVITHIATKSTNSTMALTATTIIISILELGLVREKPFPSLLSCDKSIELAVKLLLSPSVLIAEQAICVLHNILETSRTQGQQLRDNFQLKYDCAYALALVALSKGDHVTPSTKEKLLCSFSCIVYQMKSVHAVAREPTIVAMLVQIVGGTFDSAINREARAMSLAVLVEMSMNPCDRRILAKTPGLVSSMIRYIRAEPNGISLSRRNISRDELKKHILLIAEAL